MSNDFWKEFKRLVKRAEKASGGNSASKYKIAYMLMLDYAERHAPIKSEIAARADARIAELERDAARYRWLRAGHADGPYIVDWHGCMIDGNDADKEVDAARAGSGESGA